VKLVEEVFGKIGYPREKVKIVPGWFNETLTREPIKDICILHIDADWYESVKTVLQTLYHRVVPGGFVVLDDYGLWPGCQSAVLDYFSENHISEKILRRIGKQGAYFQKPYQDS
jgi:O-methyltransferase